MNGQVPHRHQQAYHRLAQLALFSLLVIFPVLLAGCATDREAQQNATPTVSGSVSIGATKHF